MAPLINLLPYSIKYFILALGFYCLGSYAGNTKELKEAFCNDYIKPRDSMDTFLSADAFLKFYNDTYFRGNYEKRKAFDECYNNADKLINEYEIKKERADKQQKERVMQEKERAKFEALKLTDKEYRDVIIERIQYLIQNGWWENKLDCNPSFQVEFTINPEGVVIQKNLLKSSNNSNFDKFLLESVFVKFPLTNSRQNKGYNFILPVNLKKPKNCDNSNTPNSATSNNSSEINRPESIADANDRERKERIDRLRRDAAPSGN